MVIQFPILSRTPRRKVKKKVRSVASVHKMQDEMREELIAEHMRQLQTVDDKEELWHRRKGKKQQR